MEEPIDRERNSIQPTRKSLESIIQQAQCPVILLDWIGAELAEVPGLVRGPGLCQKGETLRGQRVWQGRNEPKVLSKMGLTQCQSRIYLDALLAPSDRKRDENVQSKVDVSRIEANSSMERLR
jgi:hypothetical protein